MAKFVTLGDFAVRLDEVAAFCRGIDGPLNHGPWTLVVWLKSSRFTDRQEEFIIQDPVGEHYEKLKRAMEDE